MYEDMKKYFALMESATNDQEGHECDNPEECEVCQGKELDESFVIEAEGEHKDRIQKVIKAFEGMESEAGYDMCVKALGECDGETYSSSVSGVLEDLVPMLEGDMEKLEKVEAILGECGDMNEDIDSELDLAIADSYADEPEEELAYDPEMDLELEPAPELDMEPEVEEEKVTFNYTATIQVHGYDFPLVLQSDDMDEIKTVMRVLEQSGLDPQGEYKWNSKAITLDADEE